MSQIYLFCILSFVRLIECDVEPFVVGGKKAKIEKFPHSVFLNIFCRDEDGWDIPWICGGSIVNQKITLTAAHCLAGCSSMSSMTISVGHADKNHAIASSASGYKIHEKYRSVDTSYDIALITSVTSLNFGNEVKRVVLMPNPPYDEKAQVAGWGSTNEIFQEDWDTEVDPLQYIDQYVLKSKACRQYITALPKGTICASSGNNVSYASGGDSGSALVVRGYIQIGIVSYKMPKVSKSLVVYTDTGYFYDWIKKNSRRLYCS